MGAQLHICSTIRLIFFWGEAKNPIFAVPKNEVAIPKFEDR